MLFLGAIEIMVEYCMYTLSSYSYIFIMVYSMLLLFRELLCYFSLARDLSKQV